MRGIQIQPVAFTVGGRYEIRDAPIGQGGMGVVYKAYDIVTRRYVALKTVSSLGNPKALDLFEKEWSVLARLSHPNIVDVLETGQFEDNGHRKPFFVMPLLPGMTLDRLINNNSHRLTVDRTVDIIAQTCRGLQAAHDHGLVHGDVKPSNIFVLDDDSVKIIDFGVVHLAEVRTVTGMKGTLQYLAPELLAGKPPSPLSDIFALAVVCYEALTGRKPFARPTEAETAEAIRTYIPPLASEINAAVNQLVSRTLHKATAKQPLHRFSGAREFGEVLKKALRNEPIECFDSARIQPRIERAKKAQGEGDYQFARDILNELEAEGHLDPQIPVLRIKLDQTIQQKTIRQLLVNARTRMEEEEYPLALQKIQEILEIAPQQVDALHLKAEIEKRRDDKQIEQWYRLVHQHIGNRGFSQARQALEEILQLRPSDVQAHALLAQVDQQEKESIAIRKEREQLYESALYCYHQGEISTALDKLERVLSLSRQLPGTENALKEAQYESLYKQIRSEREQFRNAYAEARRHLGEKDFDGVLALCAEVLRKNPADPLFQALKLEAEERERQELSAAVAETGRRLEAEADLDRQISILKEAAQRYPKEAHFQENWNLIRERRDLVNSMVNKAKQHEQRSQFAEALGQWDILRNIYNRYPGLDVEVERLTRRRDEQAREERKSRWVRQINEELEVGDYEKAQSALREAFNEFPGDRELNSLEKLIAQGIERRTEAESHFEEGKKLCESGDYENGISRLRKAAELDSRNWTIHAALLNALLDHGRTLLNKDWQSAKPLIQEALQLEEGNPVARSTNPADPLFQALKLEAEERERQELSAAVAETGRRLGAEADLDRQISILKEAAERYPKEAHFQENLKLIRERRDLVNSTVNKAKQYEQRSQFAEALGQWDILRNIYSKYAGLDVEVERLTRRRDEQAREERKSRWVRQIDQQLEVGDYEKALSALREAFNEFPGDRELNSLEKLIAQGIERRTEAESHFEEGKKLCESGDYENGISRLRKAAERDRHNWTIRAALLNALLDHGRTLLNKDWQAAKPLIQEALQLEEGNPVARSLFAQVQDHERQAEVDICVWEARDLQAAGDLQGALLRVQAVLKKYANDMRLSQLQTTLLNALHAEPSRAGQSPTPPPTPKRNRLSLAGDSESQEQEAPLGAQRLGDANSPSVAMAPESQVAAAPFADRPAGLSDRKSPLLQPWQWVRAALKKYSNDLRLSQLRTTLLNIPHAEPERSVLAPKTPPPTVKGNRLSPASAGEAQEEEEGNKAAQSLSDSNAPAVAIALETPPPTPSAYHSPPTPTPSDYQPTGLNGRKLPLLKPWQWLCLIVVPFLIVAVLGAIYFAHKSRPAVLPKTVSVPVELRANVEGVKFKVDGRSVDSDNVSLEAGREHVVEASREGYQTEVKKLAPSTVAAGPIEFNLTALLPKLSFFSDLGRGQVSIGEQQPVPLQSGQFGPEELASGSTTLKIWDGHRLLLELPLDIQPGKAATLSGPMQARDCSVVVVSMLGNSARVYSSPDLKGNTGMLPPQTIPPDGLVIDTSAAGPEFNLSDGRSLPLQSSNTPLLTISLSTSGEGGILQIQANVSEAQVKVDGKTRKDAITNGAKTVWLGTGKHQIQLVAPGYADSEVREVEIVKGKAAKEVFALNPLQAQFVLEAAEPGAAVYIDGDERGTTSESGSLKLDVSPGEHRIVLKKRDYEDSPTLTREFKGTETINGKQLPLLKNGSLNFNVTPANATITLRSGNEPPKVVRANETVFLKRGTYTWAVEASHFQSVSETSVVAPGSSTTIALKLQPVGPRDLTPADLFENPSYWSRSGDWWVFKQVDYGWLRLKNGSFSVIIEKQPGALWGKKKAEWTLDYRGPGDRIAYTAGGHTLTRQVISGGSASTPVKDQFKEQSDVYQFILDVSPARIVVRDNSNNVIDEVKRSDPSVALGKIGFRGDIFMRIQPLR